MTDTSDEIFMRAALEEARKGRYIAPPNPAVGCVIVKDGQIVSRGYTHAPGSQHAEIDAIMNAKQAGIDITGATYYVTLEPCSHYGRTQPCAARLIEERAGRVVAAIEDPNPQVAGKGLEMLRQAGVAVVCGVCRDEAYESNIGFFTRMTTGKPWVRLKTAVTLDGRTALYNGASRWITSEEARRKGRLWRARAQGILTGIGTVLADNPQMSVREEKLPSPVKYVADSQALTPVTFNILQGQPTTIFVSDTAPQARVDALVAAGATVRCVGGSEGLDLEEIIRQIGRDEINELHVEAGATLSGALLDADLVDEIVCYLAPAVMGEGMPFAKLGPFKEMSEVLRGRFVSFEKVGDDLEVVLRKN